MVEEVQQATEVARSISDFGALATMSGVYLVLSAAVMISIFWWFKSIINQILEDNRTRLEAIVVSENKQTEMLVDISEGLKVENTLRIRNLSGFAFDLSVEQVCRLIEDVREQNHIIDHEATKHKIRNLVANIHEDRKSRFDPFTYKGKSLSEYCKDEWIERVAKVVAGEIYNEHGPDGKRAHTNVKMVYDDIKLDFYHSLKS